MKKVKKLQSGFIVNLNGQDVTFSLKVQAQFAYLPAKAASWMIKQYNGKFVITQEFHSNPALWLEYFLSKTGGKFLVLGNMKISVSISACQHTNAADVQGSRFFGIKGASVLLQIMRFPDEVPIEYMHLCLEGEFKRKMKYHMENHITNEDLSYINKKLSNE